MTDLDKFQPEGEPIHPFDLYELMNSNESLEDVLSSILIHKTKNPDPVDENDYSRNLHKIGEVIIYRGKTYFQTSSIEPRTTLIQ